MGVVERIKYDPNRSSWIALVRWKFYILVLGIKLLFTKCVLRKRHDVNRDIDIIQLNL
jgi:hypothetical protein